MSRIRDPYVKGRFAFPKLMKHIGIWIEDTDLNRRAAEFAGQTIMQDRSRENQRRRAQMAKKFSKESVDYTDDHGKSPEQCSLCSHYLNPTTCAIVVGRIRPEGWCKKFEPKVEAKAA